jgi:hypothetical protein
MEVYLHLFIYLHSVVLGLRTRTCLHVIPFKHTNYFTLPEILIVCSTEETFKVYGTVEDINCVYGPPENPHIHVDKAINSPGLAVRCGLSCRGLILPFFKKEFSMCFGPPFYLPLISSVGMSHFALNTTTLLRKRLKLPQ